jgi:hypothetical protein
MIVFIVVPDTIYTVVPLCVIKDFEDIFTRLAVLVESFVTRSDASVDSDCRNTFPLVESRIDVNTYDVKNVCVVPDVRFDFFTPLKDPILYIQFEVDEYTASVASVNV